MPSKTFKRKNMKSKNRKLRTNKTQKRNSKRSFSNRKLRSNVRRMRGGGNGDLVLESGVSHNFDDYINMNKTQLKNAVIICLPKYIIEDDSLDSNEKLLLQSLKMLESKTHNNKNKNLNKNKTISIKYRSDNCNFNLFSVKTDNTLELFIEEFKPENPITLLVKGWIKTTPDEKTNVRDLWKDVWLDYEKLDNQDVDQIKTKNVNNNEVL